MQDTAGTYAGLISGTGAVEKNLGGDLTLAGANTYSGGTTINGGTLFISSDNNLGAASGGLTLNGGYLGSVANVTTSRVTTIERPGGGFNTASGTTLTHSGVIGGSGVLTKIGAGTAVLTASNSYTGGTVISAGVLQIAGNSNLGAASSLLGFTGGTLRTTTDMTMTRTALIGAAGGALETVTGTTLTYDGLLAGPGVLTKIGAGTLIPTASNLHGGMAINGGVVQISSNANLGTAAAAVSFNTGTLRAAGGVTIARPGTLNAGGGTIEVNGDPYDNAAAVAFSGVIGGAGGLNKTGAGSLFLTGNNSYAGPTNVTGGFLFVDGDQSAATGPVTVSGAGTRLSGNGIIGGDVNLSGGASFGPAAAPNTPATLTINGNLNLASDTVLLYNIIDTTIGGALNDLTVVHGNLTLDGRIDVVDQGQDLGPGIYRVINYDGTLTDNGLEIGSFATVADVETRPITGFSVQTSIAGQVNLINTDGLPLNYWDGSAGPKNEGLIQGGNGIWYANGPNSNLEWTDANGGINAPWADGQFAIFIGQPGLVTTSNADGAVTASGMQFGVNGYLMRGDPITLVGSSATPGEATIRVGDGTTAGARVTTVLESPLTGSALLRKTDGGTLVLSGVNTYTGGTAIDGGVVRIAGDTALGAASGGLAFDGGTLETTANIAMARGTVLNSGGGTLNVASASTLTFNSAITGAGALTKAGEGTFLLNANSSYTGGTTISAGTLQIGNGGATGGIVGDVVDNGALVVNRADAMALSGSISGTGSLLQAGGGTTILTGANSYTGGTTISAGTLQIGNGGTSGSITGAITDNSILAINRSDQLMLDSTISGTGSLVHTGPGTTILTGNNSYTGATTIADGFLYVDGDQSLATGLTSVAGGARLGGDGIVGGNVTIANNGTVAPGHVPGTVATLTINGNLVLNTDSVLAYNVVQAGVVGGQLNDLTVVRGDLTLDGIVNVVDTGQPLDPGIYRLINYSGTLTNNGLSIGTYSPDGVALGTPIAGFSVQTSVQGQVNLASTSNLTLTYWDGPTLPKNNGRINGGDGTWRRGDSPSSDSNFTGSDGASNAPWSTGGFAIFTGTPGTVTVDAEGGLIQASGMQFATNGYVLQGDAVTMAGGPSSIIRVGDGAGGGANIAATITADLAGATRITKTDLGTLVLGAANSFTGGVTVNGGTVQVSSDANLGGTSGRLTLNGGALRTSADMATARPVTMASDGGTFEVLPSTTLTIGSAIDGNGALTKTGSGALLLTSDATYTGGTTISAGTLQLGNGGAAGSVIGDIVDNARLVVNRSDVLTLSGVISGTGSLEQAGAGTTILAADESYTGGTTISAGTLQLGNGGAAGGVVGDIVDNARLIINRSDALTLSGAISGTGSLEQAGTGTTILAADESYTGGTTISAGTLQLGDGGTAGSIIGSVLDNGTLAFNRSDFVTFAGSITGTGSMVHLGTGTTIFTGLNTYSGGTTISAGTVQVGDGGTIGTIFGDILNNGILIVDRSDDLTYGGSISGTGSAIKEGAGTLIATGTGTYTGGTTINEGTLQLGNGGTSGSLLGDVVNNARFAVNRSDSLLLNGVISGAGSFEQMGGGTTVFGADNSYMGGTTVSAGTLQIGNGGASGSVVGNVVNNGTLAFNRSDTFTYASTVSGSGDLIQSGLGTLILSGANSYAGGTTIDAGTLQISSDANLGAASGPLRIFNATLSTTADITSARGTTLTDLVATIDTASGTTLTLNGLVSGAGGLTKAGGGTLILTDSNSYAGSTIVSAGTLRVNGDQTATTGLTTVNNGATLGGSGTVGGDVTIADGGILATGNSPGTLTINGDLTLNSGSILSYEFGQANTVGGTLNDLTIVGGNLVLDGTLNVTVSAGGTFGPGIYRVIDYAGTLTDNGLAIGTIPSPDYYVNTLVANQVSLATTTGLTLNYWDGAAGIRSDGIITGGDGAWQNSSGNDNWTSDSGTPNAPWASGGFAIFAAAPGTVTVDASLGSVDASGMQFATDGYVVQGDVINLTDGTAIIRVGDGTASGAGYTATINSALTGAATLEKADIGTLILTSANSYIGGTQINGGVVQISSDGNLGGAAGVLGLDGGALRATASMTSARSITLGTGGGAFEPLAGVGLTLSGGVAGTGGLTKIGDGTLILTADNSYTGGTTINAGTLRLGNGGITGSIVGDVIDNGTLIFDRAGSLTFNGVVSGSGALVQAGVGTTILTANNSYTGFTTVSGGALYIDGDQSAAIGANNVANGAILGGNGIIGGSVNIAGGGVLAPGGAGVAPGTLTIKGDLALDGGAVLAYSFGQANVVGGPLNDLATVQGNLTLNGTLNVDTSAGGSFDPGIYRVLNYTGMLTNNGLALGTIPAGGFFVQTSVANQVNLVNATGLTLNFWDGAAGSRNDGIISGGDGVWQNASGNDNWTAVEGTPNAPWASESFAVFMATPGTVTVDDSLGAVSASGMQFATDGYVVQGDVIDLTGDNAIIRVGDGASSGAAYTATINSALAGGAVLEKTDLGTLILAGINSYAGGTQIDGGVLQVSSDANLGAAAGTLGLDGGTLRTTADMTTARTATLGADGGIFETLGSTTFTLNSAVGGAGSLTKLGPGTLILSNANSYAGDTRINGGVVQVSSDANLGSTVGGVRFDGGTLHITGNVTSSRAVTFDGPGRILTDATVTLGGTMAGMGDFTKDGAGTLLLTGNGSGYAGVGHIAAGTLAVDGTLGGALDVRAAGRLEGNGRVGGVANSGVIAPGRGGIGTLTIAGNYMGNGGKLEIDAALGDDNSPADRLVVTGSTAGTTQVSVINRDGLGAQTMNGIKIIDVGGVSNGVFTLNGDYMFEGAPAVVAGAFGYRLYKNGITDSSDGDWYLRSSLLDPSQPGGGGGDGGDGGGNGGGDGGGSEPPPTPLPPLYQPGVPIYEVYPQTLLALNGLPTLQQRVGNRGWTTTSTQAGIGGWVRMEGARNRPQAAFSTSTADLEVDTWQAQMGMDIVLDSRSAGTLVGGITARYGEANGGVRSVYGTGAIHTQGFGIGATMTWHGAQGFYVDGQMQVSWYDSNLESGTVDMLARDNKGMGGAYGIEIGKRMAINDRFSLTPQAQVVYSTVDFDRFTDPFDAVVSMGRSDSLKSRWGVSVDYQSNWNDAVGEIRQNYVYGIVNVAYEWRDGTRVNVSDTPLINRDRRLSGELGLGGSHSWDNGRFTLYGEVSGSTAFKDFGDSYNVKGTIGFRVRL